MINAHDYNITIRHGVFEGEACFEARVKELPDIVEYGDSYAEAYELAIDTIETTAEIMAEKGRRMPPPLDIPDDFSGRVTLRLPKTLHRNLAVTAEEEGVSLNAYLTYLLSHFSGVGALGFANSLSDLLEHKGMRKKAMAVDARLEIKLVPKAQDDWQPVEGSNVVRKDFRPQRPSAAMVDASNDGEWQAVPQAV